METNKNTRENGKSLKKKRKTKWKIWTIRERVKVICWKLYKKKQERKSRSNKRAVCVHPDLRLPLPWLHQTHTQCKQLISFSLTTMPHMCHMRLPCYVNITSFHMMGDITLIVIPGTTSAARLLRNPWLGSRMCCHLHMTRRISEMLTAINFCDMQKMSF